MRLATFGLIPLVVALRLSGLVQSQESLDQQLLNVISTSQYTVPFSQYITLAELPAGESLELATVSTRLCGTGLVNSSGQVNRPLLQDITEFTFGNVTSYYYVDIVKAATAQVAPVSYPGAITEGSVQATALNLSAYDCIDVQMTLSAFRYASMVDFGLTNTLWGRMEAQYLRTEGWAVGQVTTTNMIVAPAAVPYLRRIPLAPTASFNFTLQIMSSDLLCCAVEDQSLVLFVMDILVSNVTNLITLRIVNTTSYDNGSSLLDEYPYAANFTLTASTSTYAPVPSLQVAVQAILSSGTGSLFSQQMLNNSVNAVASASDFMAVPGDAFSEQVADYTGNSNDSKVPLGLSVGVSIAGAAILATSATFAFYILRHKRQNKQQKAKLAAVGYSLPWLQPEAGADRGLGGHAGSSTSSSSPVHLTSVPVAGQWLNSDGGAAQPWDLDPAEITVCKRPDGSDWVLGVGSFGQVVKGLRGGVQDVALKMLIGETHYHVNSFRQEIEILKSLSFDRSIVQFYGTCPWQGKTMLVLEHMEGGDLRQALTEAPAELHWYNKGAPVALDIIKGLHFLHKHMVVHMDIKPKNVLLTADYSIAKIADVGLAHIMGSAPGSQAMGTFAYAAPEQLLHQPCDEKVDIYSFGVLLWELVTATPPMRGRLRPVKVPAECPQEIAELIDHCLSMEPQSRPSARDVFDVISKVQLAQDQQVAQDPWDANEGPPQFALQEPQPAPVLHAPSLQQPDQHSGQPASSSQRHDQILVQQASSNLAPFLRHLSDAD